MSCLNNHELTENQGYITRQSRGSPGSRADTTRPDNKLFVGGPWIRLGARVSTGKDVGHHFFIDYHCTVSQTAEALVCKTR